MLDPRTPLWPTRIGFRLIAAVLAMVMLVQVVPATAFARPKITPLNSSEITTLAPDDLLEGEGDPPEAASPQQGDDGTPG